MAEQDADIIIYGAGIAGLWTLAHLRELGYDALLLEKEAIGGMQTIASQGIIHSGLKYAMAGKVNDLARSISTMPDLWREALSGKGPVNLSTTHVAAQSQHLLIPSGLMGSMIKLIARKTLGNGVKEIPRQDWPEGIQQSGFQGSVIFMSEPVLDVPSVVRALAEPHKNYIRRGTPQTLVKAQLYIHTSGAGNQDSGVETQARPLLMGLMKNAPFPLFTHLVGASEKPVATITTHTAQDDSLIWYVGGAAAERAKNANPQETYDAIKVAFRKYLPAVDLSGIEWSTFGIDRIEGKTKTANWMPDTPTIHHSGNHLYAWPTKLTFTPMMSNMIVDHLNKNNIRPSGTQKDWSHLPALTYAEPPWNKARWTKQD